MAQNIIAQVAGGTKQVLDGVITVSDVAVKMAATQGYTASINGDPVEFTTELNDGDMVTFAKAGKGGLI